MSKDEILVGDWRIGSVSVDWGRFDAMVGDWSRIGTRLALTFFDWRRIDIVFWVPLFANQRIGRTGATGWWICTDRSDVSVMC